MATASKPAPQSARSREIIDRVSDNVVTSKVFKAKAKAREAASMNDEEKAEAEAAQQEAIKAQVRPIANKRLLNKDDTAYRDALLDEVNVQQEHVQDKLGIAKMGAHNMIHMLMNYRDADADERFLLKEDALVQGVQLLEALQIAEKRIASMKKACTKRLTSTFGWDGPILKRTLAERQKGPHQLVLDLENTARAGCDTMHKLLESRGVARKGDDNAPVTPKKPGEKPFKKKFGKGRK